MNSNPNLCVKLQWKTSPDIYGPLLRAAKILISPEEFLQHSQSQEKLWLFLYLVPWLLLNSKVLGLINPSLLNLTAPANTFWRTPRLSWSLPREERSIEFTNYLETIERCHITDLGTSYSSVKIIKQRVETTDLSFQQHHLRFLNSPTSFSVFMGVPTSRETQLISWNICVQNVFHHANPVNIADVIPICLENSLRDYVFAHYNDFILDPDILQYTPSL